MQNKLKTLGKALIITGVIGAVSLPAAAKKYRDYNNAAYDYAHVVDVDPVYQSYQVNHPVKKCYDKHVPIKHSKRFHGGKSRTPDILGAVIGGAIGNQFGSGRGRDVATVAGAVLGGSIGGDFRRAKSHKYNDKRSYAHSKQARFRAVKHCDVVDSYTTKKKIVGYDVAYKYRGNVFHTHLNQHPGDKIKVKVTVNPV